MEIGEFADMVKSIRNVEKAIGEVVYPTDPSKIKGREFCRSLYVAEDIKAGEIITEKNQSIELKKFQIFYLRNYLYIRSIHLLKKENIFYAIKLKNKCY